MMKYPAYRLTGPAGVRTFFWFCFARLKEIDEGARHYSDYLGAEYQCEGRMPLWPAVENGTSNGNASDFDNLEVALHAPEWSTELVQEIMFMPVFEDIEWTKEGEHFVFSIDLTGRYIYEIMYPMMLIRDILCGREIFDELVMKGLNIQQAALMASQLSMSKDFRGFPVIEQTSDDYVLAESFRALAMLLTHKPKYDDRKWGYYQGGYRDFNELCELPDKLFNVTGTLIEDVTDAFEADDFEGDAFGIIVDSFKEAMEANNAKA